MNRELFVTATPHETKVGLVEDDQLAEIYLELENEYTLAGSIYKGRVTRVLPGMQSAFVDIGLERDAFLYVSDFMELEDSEDLDDVPTNRPQQQEPRLQARPAIEGQNARADLEEEAPAHGNGHSQLQGEGETQPRVEGERGEREGRGGFRGGRRRRRGRRGERLPESKFARPEPEAPVQEAPRETPRVERSERFDRGERPHRGERPERTQRDDFGPPPGYQPMVLPGESISKYSQRMSLCLPTGMNPIARWKRGNGHRRKRIPHGNASRKDCTR